MRLFMMGTCLLAAWTAAGDPAMLDLSKAVLVARSDETRHAKAAAMLQDEIARRCGIRLPISAQAPPPEDAALLLGTVAEFPAPEGVAVPKQAEGYAISVTGQRVYALGRDERGMLFAAGRLILLLDCAADTLQLRADTRIATAPKYALRGTQLGYRATANSYDAWDIATYEQYIRDLVLFGANSIELVPGFDPEEVEGRVMKRPMGEMNREIAGLLDAYGLDLWFWIAALEDLSKPAEAKKALEDRRALLHSVKRLAGVFVPGGDDGTNPARALIPWLADFAQVLREEHPEATLWVSNQTFSHEDNAYFFDWLEHAQPDWLTGVVYGPWTKMSLPEMRARTPGRYKLRAYPDITHTIRCQYPVPDWDRAFAHTLGREPVCPRPRAMAQLHNLYAPQTEGFLAYSDGIHDDLNKCVWLACAWDPESGPDTAVQDYAKAFFPRSAAGLAAEGLNLLECNWEGPLLENPWIGKTLATWREAAEKHPAELEGNWRLQMYLFRAWYDAYVARKAALDAMQEGGAYTVLGQMGELGDQKAIEEARAILGKNEPDAELLDARGRIESLARQLLHSIGFQLSVKEPYFAKNPERGAVLDFLDTPLNDRVWLAGQLEAAAKKHFRNARVEAINCLTRWTNPGPGGFYDDLGNPAMSLHVLRPRTWAEDPGFVQSVQCEYMDAPETPLSWQDQAQTLYGTPLTMHYDGLEAQARYRVRVTYAGRFKPTLRLVADGIHEIHGPLAQPQPVQPVEFHVPAAATADGSLDLEWQLVDGRGCQVAEVWLLKQ